MRNRGEDLHDPEFAGPIGRAWEMGANQDALTEHSVGMWLIEAPINGSPYNYHMANLMHLRTVPGLPQPLIIYPNASHQFVMFPLHRSGDNGYDPNDFESIAPFTVPTPDVVQQFKAESDPTALTISRVAIQKCLDGELLPVQQDLGKWAAYFRGTES